ncbi:hypothetical protein Nham_4124 (plasmid) [Nitrobacter hamburgensis X14]|uniref:Uncharacterized protein n=1 Tax=Nitrobacter hamburgensis (strain DSM 10229 / NCIMB 13809 / X14) TaxID=323097 RepID=Q1QG79_NITHX|nr:hypothetical protein Nham_4124 [Nitrobacter hamburgensis X14]
MGPDPSTLGDATIIASASEDDGEAHWVNHKGKPAVHGFKARVGANADTALVEQIAVTPANINDSKAGPAALPDNPGEVLPTAPIGETISAMPSAPGAAHRALSPPACGGDMKPERWHTLLPGTSPFIGYEVGSRRSSARSASRDPDRSRTCRNLSRQGARSGRGGGGGENSIFLGDPA